MKQLGWKHTRLRRGGGMRSYYYVRGQEPYRNISVSSAGYGALPYACYNPTDVPHY
jgi:hypothetical protein